MRAAHAGARDALGTARRTSLPTSYFAEWHVIHFIDNVGALSGLIKGVSRAVDSLAIIRSFMVANMSVQADVWFSYVASKANIADLPSRGALDEMAAVLRGVPIGTAAESGVPLLGCARQLG